MMKLFHNLWTLRDNLENITWARRLKLKLQDVHFPLLFYTNLAKCQQHAACVKMNSDLQINQMCHRSSGCSDYNIDHEHPSGCSACWTKTHLSDEKPEHKFTLRCIPTVSLPSTFTALMLSWCSYQSFAWNSESARASPEPLRGYESLLSQAARSLTVPFITHWNVSKCACKCGISQRHLANYTTK